MIGAAFGALWRVGKGSLGYWATYVVAAMTALLYAISSRFRVFVQFVGQLIWDLGVYCLEQLWFVIWSTKEWVWTTTEALAYQGLSLAFNAMGLPQRSLDDAFLWVEQFNQWVPIDTITTICGLVVTAYASRLSLNVVGRLLGGLR